MKVRFIYSIDSNSQDYSTIVDVPNDMDRDSLVNFWSANVRKGLHSTARLKDIEVIGDINLKNVPQVYGHYQYRYEKDKDNCFLEVRKVVLTLDSEPLLLPERLPITEAISFAYELLEKKGYNKNDWKVTDVSFILDTNSNERTPIPVWIKVRETSEEFLNWTQGLQYDRDIVLTGFGLFCDPDSPDDIKPINDRPF